MYIHMPHVCMYVCMYDEYSLTNSIPSSALSLCSIVAPSVSFSQAPTQTHRKITTPSKDDNKSATSKTSVSPGHKDQTNNGDADGTDVPSPQIVKEVPIEKYDTDVSNNDNNDDGNSKTNTTTNDLNDTNNISLSPGKDGKMLMNSSSAVEVDIKQPLKKEGRQVKAISNYIQKQMKVRLRKAQELMQQEAEDIAKKEKREAVVKKKKMEVSLCVYLFVFG